MYSIESLPLIRVWLDAEQLASTARLLMDGHRVPAIGVVDSDRNLIGWVTQLQVFGATAQTKLGDIMVSAPSPLDAHVSVREAASELIKQDIDCLPVIQHGKFSSIVTSRSLLGKLRESYDPMTELPWSDALRDWGIDQLEKGVEIVILFVDLNDFGKFNKQFGHVVGDRVIQKVSSHLRSKIDPKTDILVRYGGDEFAIGTSRDRDDADDLMAAILGDGTGLRVDSVDQSVTFTVGIYGGRRTKTRTDVHGASNLDNLVNLASGDCLARKEGTAVEEPATEDAHELEPPAVAAVVDAQVEPAFEEIPSKAVVSQMNWTPNAPNTDPTGSHESKAVVETVQADDEPNSLTYVVIRVGDKQFVGTSVKMGHSKAESIAIATGKALEKAFPGVKVNIDSVLIESKGSTDLVTARVRTTKGNLERDVTAQAEANGDLEDTIGLAVFSAFLAE